MKFSIITINYNNKEGLKRTIDSVVAQTFRDFEWLLIDGGSTDGSRELIEENKHHFSYWCSEKDNGVYNAQNKGIQRAKGEYVLLLNSGDCLAGSNVLAEVIKCGVQSDFILGNMIVHEGGDDYIWDIKEEALTARQFFYGTLPHPGTFIKRTMFEQFGLYDEEMKICSDWKFFVEAILIGQATLKKIPVTISVFEGGGISDQMIEQSHKERKQVLDKIFLPLVQEDYRMLNSLLELKRVWIFDKLYSVLYRMSVSWQDLFCKERKIGPNFRKL
ncbi:MAG: glycosyltransferase [Bacteroidaceae bacterium]|nr:glycosyltransferase [Bacteroidaceae bacterium]